MASRVEIGVVGVGPAPAQLTTKELPETVVINFAKVCNLWCHHCLYQEVTRAREGAREREGARARVAVGFCGAHGSSGVRGAADDR